MLNADLGETLSLPEKQQSAHITLEDSKMFLSL